MSCLRDKTEQFRVWRELLNIGLIQPGGNSLKFHVLPIPAVDVLEVLQALQVLQFGSTTYCTFVEES